MVYFGQKPTTQGGGVAVTRLQFIFTEKTGRGKGADWAENLAPCLDCLTWCLGRRLPRLPSCKSARHNLKKIDTKSWKQPKYLFYYEVLESYIPPGWLPPFSSRNTFILSPFSAAAQQSIAKQQQCAELKLWISPCLVIKWGRKEDRGGEFLWLFFCRKHHKKKK